MLDQSEALKSYFEKMVSARDATPMSLPSEEKVLNSSYNMSNQYKHKQFVSKVAGNNSKNQALTKYKASHMGLYRLKSA